MVKDYSKGKIYTIRFHNDDNNIYIGSTTQTLAKRFGGHKTNKNNSKLQKYILDTYNGDWTYCYIELYELCPCISKIELDAKEGGIIRQFKADTNYKVINQNIAGRKSKQYYDDNQTNILNKKKDYYIKNRLKRLAYQNNYYKNIKKKVIDL